MRLVCFQSGGVMGWCFFVLVPGILRSNELSENIWNIRSYECGNRYEELESKTTF